MEEEHRDNNSNLLESILDGIMEPGHVPFPLLEKITGNFCEDQIIGDGGFAVVYKGVLQNGKEVAVKRIRNHMTINEKLFEREVTNLMQVNHENIVRFLGYCFNAVHRHLKHEGNVIFPESREMLLCFAYINNGSLDKYIKDELRGLEWNTRYNIIKGLCDGLKYLHVERRIVHMDLKPANIMLDHDMKAKITDFGLSRMSENSQTITKNLFGTPGYYPPEYIQHGKISYKYDVYSLGVIIIEVITGCRYTPDKKNVLRRWRHRQDKSGQETPFRYQQVDKLVEIGLLCTNIDPCKRPSISEIIHDINELECTDMQINNGDEPTVGQISLYTEDDMLGIEPLELCFHFELNKETSCPLKLTNKTNAYTAFSIQTMSHKRISYFIEPTKGIVPPQSECSVNITLQPLDKASEYKQHTTDFVVSSTKVNGSLTPEEITKDMFHEQEGRVVDEVNVTVVLAEAESKINSSALADLIRFDPPKLCFPLVPYTRVASSVKIVNITNSYVGWNIIFLLKPNPASYFVSPMRGILPPLGTQCLVMTREEKEEALEDTQFNDKFFVWNAVVPEDFKDMDLGSTDLNESKELPMVLTEISRCTSNELIQLDPPELRFPLLPNRKLLSLVKIVNITDFNIWFTVRCSNDIAGMYNVDPYLGIVPPRSTQRLVIKRVPTEKELSDAIFHRKGGKQHCNLLDHMPYCQGKLFVHNMVVAKGVEADFLHDFVPHTYINLPIILTKAMENNYPPVTNSALFDLSVKLIRFHPPRLSFPFLPNRTLLSSVKVINRTDYPVVFCNYVWNAKARYYTEPRCGILKPRCGKKLVVKRVPTENEPLGMKCKEKYILWSAIVAHNVEASDLISCIMKNEEGKELPNEDLYDAAVEQDKGSWWPGFTLFARVGWNFEYTQLPIVLNKISPSVGNQVIQIAPPELCFPFLPKGTDQNTSINIVNITDFFVGFNTFEKKTNVACYNTEPPYGILPPNSTRELLITRVAKEDAEALEDMMYCKDKYFLWSSFVTQDVNAIYLSRCTSERESKCLPIVFTKISDPSVGNEVIQIAPPELCFPFLPRGTRNTSINIVNITDFFVGFNTFEKKTNVACYKTEPPCGILPPNSTRELLVTRVAKEDAEALEDMLYCKDNYFLWSRFVTPDVDAIYLSRCTSERESKCLPILFTKTSSNELIRFDPPKLYLPLSSNKSVLSSVNIVNVTDHSISYSICTTKSSSAWYYTDPLKGILSPRSTQALRVTRVPEEKKLQDANFKDQYFVCSRIIPDGGVSESIVEQESKELPIVFTKEIKRPRTSEELIRFEPPVLSFPVLSNKTVVSSFTIINNTNFNIGFRVMDSQANEGTYKVDPDPRLLPPRSSHRILVKRVPTGEDIQGSKKDTHQDWLLPLERKTNQDMLLVWHMMLAEGVQAQNLVNYLCVGNTKELPVVLTKIIPFTSNELIRFDPPQLYFPFLQNKTLLSSINMINNTYHSVVFCNYVWNAKARYYTEPRYGILPPQSTQKLVVKRVPMENEPQDMKCKDKYIVWNSIVTEGVEASDLSCLMTDEDGRQLPNHDLYYQTEEQGKGTLWTWPKLKYYGCVLPQKENTPLPIILTKISSTTANEVIQIEPHELCFPFLPSTSQKYSIKISNITDQIVGFNTFGKETNVASYNTEPQCGILPPNSTRELVVTRVAQQEEVLEDMMHCKDKYFLWSSFVTQDVDAINLKGCTSEAESKELPIVFTETSSNQWIQFDPPELCLPLLLSKNVLSPVNIVNVTDHHISFSICTKSNSAKYYTDPSKGILRPRSRQVLKVIREAEEKELHDTEIKDKYMVWNSVVTEGAEASNVTELPIVFTKTPLKASIQFDPPELCFPVLPKGKVLSSINIVNITGSYIDFSTYSGPTNAAWYHTEPSRGILPPRATQRLMVTREEKKYAPRNIQFSDKYFVWNNIVPKGVKGSDASDYMVEQESKELPIVLTKTSTPCTSEQLIRFDPAALIFPFKKDKAVVSSVTIINNTDYCVGFNQCADKGNVAWYHTNPPRGIIPPRSTQRLVVKRVPKRKGQGEDMQGGDKFFLWNMTVTQGVKVGDLINRIDDENCTQLPIVLQKTSLLCTSDDLVQFNPRELCFPFFPNKKVPTLCKVKIVNVTDHNVGFGTWSMNRNSATYNFDPSEGILPPLSAQTLKVRREPKEKESENMKCEEDVVGVWNVIVNKGIEAGDLTDNFNDEESKLLPIALTKTSPPSNSEELLIQFDPAELSFPFLPNKTVVSSFTIINNTNCCVGFNKHNNKGNVAWYNTNPQRGILPPKSRQRLTVRRVAKEKEHRDMQRLDRIFLWNMIVTEGVEARDLAGCVDDNYSTELPIVLEKTSLLCSSDELIKFDPPQLRFPYSTDKRAIRMCSINIVNVTDHPVGFNLWDRSDNLAFYHFLNGSGILGPRSPRAINVRRVPKQNESDDMQCKDVVCVWNDIVTQGVEASDLTCFTAAESNKQLPIVLIEPEESSSSQSLLRRILGM